MYDFRTNEVGETAPEEIAKLLRSIGASGRLLGFDYTVYIVHSITNRKSGRHQITKSIYPSTASYFNVSASSVERAVRTLITSCWDRYDHSDLNRVAGIELEDMPTNSEFIDILVAYLSYGAYDRTDNKIRI